MHSPSRFYYVLGATSAALLLYVCVTSLPHSSHINVETRLRDWLDLVSAPEGRPTWEPTPAVNPQPRITFDPLPLGLDHRPAAYDAFLQGKPLSNNSNISNEPDGVHFKDFVYDFQRPGIFPLPHVNLLDFRRFPPHNHRSKTPANTFATFLCTLNSSLNDPYFAATQQLVWRMLWAPETASKHYSFTVFVAPFIPQNQRDILAGAGANVVELNLIGWNPNVDVHTRWVYIFTKLNMWAHTEFKRIAFLDSDVFPIRNIDDIFDLAARPEPQRCVSARLGAEDSMRKDDLCDYTFAAVELGTTATVNVGVMVLQPNMAMHVRLLRDMKNPDLFNHAEAEQGFLNFAFSRDGPFPVKFLPREYNGFFPGPDDEKVLKVVHDKLWSTSIKSPQWIQSLWNTGWDQMIDFYDSAEFKQMREKDAVDVEQLSIPWWKKITVGHV